MTPVVRSIVVAALATCPITSAAAQALPDSLVAQVRAGAAHSLLRADSVVVPLAGTPTLPLVEVTINGRGPYRFLIDLGSNVVVVRNAVAAAAKGQVLVDRARGDIIRFDSLTIGSARFERVVVAGYDTLDVDGVIGYNLLQRHSFTLDYPSGRFALHERVLPEADFVTTFPYTIDGRMPMLSVRVGRDSIVMNLDTGAEEWMTIPPALEQRFRWRGTIGDGPLTSNNQTGARRVRRGTLADTTRVGPLSFPGMTVYLNPDADGPWIGSSAMRHAAWTFDPRNLRVSIRSR